MNLHDTRMALKKQREINRRLSEQLRAERMVSNALSHLVWRVKDQKPFAVRKLRNALALRKTLDEGKSPREFYPTGGSQAA